MPVRDMIAPMKALFFTLLTILTPAVAPLFAQNDHFYKKELGFTLGFSPDSYNGIIGITTGNRYYEASLNFGYVFWQNDNYAWKYKASLIPFALVHGDEATLLQRASRAVYAGGAEPVGLQLNFRNHHKLQPFVNATGGFLYFTEQVPVADSSQYNFTFSFGGGVEIFSSRHSLSFGGRYHHISNGGTGNHNPGIDLLMLSTGFSFKR